MRRIILVLATILTLCAFVAQGDEAHSNEVPIDGAFHYAASDPSGSGIAFEFSVTEPMYISVTLKVEMRCGARIYRTDDWMYVYHFSSVLDGTSDNPRTASVNVFLNAGRYCVTIEPRDLSAGRAGIMLNAIPTRLTEIEPNDDISQAMPISIGQTVNAGIGQSHDTDFYKVEITRAGDYTLEIEGYMANLDCASYDSGQFLIDESGVSLGASVQKPMSTEKALSLPQGTAYIRLRDSIRQSSDGPFYNIRLVAPSASDSFSIPSKQKVTAGFSAQMIVKANPAGASLPHLEWESANAAIASVDEDGVVTGYKPGKVKITCSDPASGKRASGVLTVRRNHFSRSKPVASKDNEVYASPKKLEYRAGYLNAEIFIVNRSKFALYMEDVLTVSIYQKIEGQEHVSFSRMLSRWELPGFMIRPRSRRVIKVRFPSDSAPYMDLAIGTCRTYIDGYAYTARGKRVKIASAMEENKP